MTDQEIQRVIELDKSDCRILINTRYVDTFAQIRQQDGQWWIRSHAVHMPLKELSIDRLSFWKEVTL